MLVRLWPLVQFGHSYQTSLLRLYSNPSLPSSYEIGTLSLSWRGCLSLCLFWSVFVSVSVVFWSIFWRGLAVVEQYQIQTQLMIVKGLREQAAKAWINQHLNLWLSKESAEAQTPFSKKRSRQSQFEYKRALVGCCGCTVQEERIRTDQNMDQRRTETDTDQNRHKNRPNQTQQQSKTDTKTDNNRPKHQKQSLVFDSVLC